MLKNPKTFGYFKFLESALSRIILFNKKYQSMKSIVPENEPEIQNVYTYYLKRFMNNKYVDSQKSSLNEININDENNYIPLERIILGKNTEIFMKKVQMSNDKKNEFRRNCRNFYIELCKKIRERFDFENDHAINLRCFHSKNARSTAFHHEFPDLNMIFPHFESIINEDDDDKKKCYKQRMAAVIKL